MENIVPEGGEQLRIIQVVNVYNNLSPNFQPFLLWDALSGLV